MLFAAYDDNARSHDPVRKAPQTAIYIWNTTLNELQRVVELGPMGGGLVCYERGKFRYYLWQTGEAAKERLAPIGFERDLDGHEEPWAAGPKVDANPSRGEWMRSAFGCREMWEADLVRSQHVMRDNRIWLLWPEDGYLLTTARFANYENLMSSPVEMWRPGASAPIKLPIMNKELTTSLVYFSRYKDVYIVPAGVRRDETRPSISGYFPGVKRPVYFISRQGKVQTRWFPDENWVATGNGFLPTTKGFLVISNFSRRAQSADTGAWLIDDDRIQKIIDHTVDEFSVSPNGCKAVIATANPMKQREWIHTLTVFDFCTPLVK